MARTVHVGHINVSRDELGLVICGRRKREVTWCDPWKGDRLRANEVGCRTCFHAVKSVQVPARYLTYKKVRDDYRRTLAERAKILLA